MIPLLMLRMLTGSSSSGYSCTSASWSTVNFRGFLDQWNIVQVYIHWKFTVELGKHNTAGISAVVSALVMLV